MTGTLTRVSSGMTDHIIAPGAAPPAGAVKRVLREKLSETVSVKDFGAVGDGVADDAPAFMAAAAAVGAGGTVEVPLGTYRLGSDVNAPGVCFVLYGTLTGAGKIIGHESSVVRTRGDAADIESPFGEPGGGFKAHYQINVVSDDTHDDTRANLGVKRIVSGSGSNGPTRADIGYIISVEKKNWLGAALRGEVDGLYVVVSQGGRDDQAGLLIHHQKLKDTGVPDSEAGGSVGIEIAGEWKNSSGANVMRMQTIMNYLEGPGGWSGRTGYGYWAEARQSAPSVAFFASHVPSSSWTSESWDYIGNWQNLLVGAHSQYPGAEYFLIDGSGHVRANTGTALAVSYGFTADPNTGMYRPYDNYLAFATSGEGRLVLTNDGAVLPGATNTQLLGNPSYSWSAVWAATGTIQTSDRKLKQDFRTLTTDEIAAAVEIGASIQVFRFKDAAATKGTDAREHVGVVAQEVAEILTAHGLDPWRYGFMCRDVWDDVYKMSDPVYGYRGTGEFHEVRGKREEVLERYEVAPAKPVLVTPAGEKWSVRYDELAQFVLAGQAAQMVALEARLAALEASAPT